MVQFCQKIAGDHAAGGRKNADFSRAAGRVITRAFECLPAHLQKQAMLRIHQCCVFGGVTEE